MFYNLPRLASTVEVTCVAEALNFIRTFKMAVMFIILWVFTFLLRFHKILHFIFKVY